MMAYRNGQMPNEWFITKIITDIQGQLHYTEFNQVGGGCGIV